MTVKILNKNTGFTTECSNNDVIKICKADTLNYEVSELIEQKKPQQRKKETVK